MSLCPVCNRYHDPWAPHNPQPTFPLNLHPYAPPRPAVLNSLDRLPEAFKEFNDDRRAAALELRARIAGICTDYAAAHGGELPRARQVLRALRPALGEPAQIRLRTVQWHMRAIAQGAGSIPATRDTP
jgi:hypothetical protein